MQFVAKVIYGQHFRENSTFCLQPLIEFSMGLVFSSMVSLLPN